MSGTTSRDEDKDKLAALMRDEWNRRVSHDYRYWMSDGVDSDEQMWRVGERDISLLFRRLPQFGQKEKVALEIGCGVGRLLRASANRYKKVIGLDISDKALSEARRLLSDLNNVEFLQGNGDDLQPLADNSIDLVYAFASLSSMPVSVFTRYLCDTARVLRLGGHAAIQVYLGKTQQTFAQDTIAIRSYEQNNFEAMLMMLGFNIVCMEELKLPFEISDHEEGLIATLVTVEKVAQVSVVPSQVQNCLFPIGEKMAADGWAGSPTEYAMALARARQHMDAGEAPQAKAALEFATTHYAQADSEIKQMLAELQKVEFPQKREAVVPQISTPPLHAPLVSLGGFSQAIAADFDSALYEANLRVLQDRFPAVAAQLIRVSNSSALEILRSPQNEPVIVYNKIPLDQRDKPLRAAEAFIQRAMISFKSPEVQGVVVFGCGTGYHIEQLQKLNNAPIYLIEPNPAVLKAAMGVRDLRSVLSKLHSLTLTVKDATQLKQDVAAGRAIEVLFHPQTKVLAAEEAAALGRAVYSVKARAQLQPSIGVVGPLYGGSLPISHSVMRALFHLEQRMRPFDLTVFYEPYKAMSRYVQNAARVDAIETSYVEMVSQLVLESITERPVDILICLAQAPMTPKVLEEIRRRGIITVMWFVEDYKRFTTWTSLAKYYDYMFMIQRGEILKYVEAAGAGRAIYLPVGCDPQMHHKVALTPEETKKWGSDLSFVGAGYNNRQHMFATLGHYNFKIWGTEWPGVVPFDRLVQDNARRLSVEEYVKIFNASKINLNLHSSSERDGVEPDGDFVNPRTFELAATGAFQLTDNRVYLPEVFDTKTEIATFADRKEMIEKIDYFLAKPEERAVFAQAAQRRALKDHTYQQRVQEMLDFIYADHYERIQSRLNASPWRRTLAAAEKYPELQQRFKTCFKRGDEPTLASLVGDIKQGQGALSDTERKLLFFDNISFQVKSALKSGNSA